MTDAQMQAIGQKVLARLWQAKAVSVQVSSHTTPDPDALVFMARQQEIPGRPAQAGTVYVLRAALEDHGEGAAAEGLIYLMARATAETLPTCAMTRKAPVLAVRDAEGLQVLRQGNSLPL